MISMKRVLPGVTFIFLLLFTACGERAGEVSPSLGTAVAETQTAAAWTPTFIPTVDPYEPDILSWMNAGLPSDGLEVTLDARYTALDAGFPYFPNSTSRIFSLKVRCECAINQNCCVPERMFVVTMWAMKAYADKIVPQVPENAVRVDVVCFNHLVQIGVQSASWADVKAYLLDEINGSMLGLRVTPNPSP